MRGSKILIIEDNDEVREFIKMCLEGDYTVVEAHDGKEGWVTAAEILPDLIISDVMMPEIDGNEFCKLVKNDERTSHIPVIMLTAKVAVEQQLEGLESGADLYLTKPYNIQLLKTYISNLLKSKEALRQKYSQKIFLEPSMVEIGTVDKMFMEKLMNIIENNISDPDFHVSGLSEKIGMSKAVLYKKFYALAHTPIGEFIKSMRLKKAAILLTHDKFNISEVAWEVGFSDRKYFSKEFKRFFGKSPSEYLSDGN
ncbi:MAG: response regulator transcription factor [Sphingobacteriaceae bacterium]|nr:MAG: response regulator transcription factor [Sphingobacteriaceae bacterium]